MKPPTETEKLRQHIAKTRPEAVIINLTHKWTAEKKGG